MFATSQSPGQGISAVKALQIANENGQRIYHITVANQAQVLPNLHLDALAMSEIAQALSTGKEVIAHPDKISVAGWTGEGYILFDPITGEGAYKITGGMNGGWGYLVAAIVFGILAIAILVMVGLPGILGWGWMLGLMGSMLAHYFETNPDASFDQTIWVSVRLVGFLIGIIAFGLAAFTVFTWIGLISTVVQALILIIQRFVRIFDPRRMIVKATTVTKKTLTAPGASPRLLLLETA